MTLIKKTLKSVVIAGTMFSCLWAGDVKVKNDTTMSVSVTVRAKENKTTNSPFIITQVVQPGEEITVTVDEKKFNGTTFSVQATTIPPSQPTITTPIPLTSNECVLSGYEARVVIATKSDGSALVCGVTKLNS
jgi:hypothetical protein